MTPPARPLLLCAVLVFLGASCLSPTRSGHRALERGDAEGALAAWRPLADAGDAEAQFLVGLLHDAGGDGDGVDADPAAAASWYLRAAEQGHARAQNNLGLLHYSGTGVPRSYDVAARWYERAAEQDLPEAQRTLGVVLLYGHGLPRDPVAARRCFLQAAAQEDAIAMRLLGSMHAEGIGLPQDRDEAADWFRRAAEAHQQRPPLSRSTKVRPMVSSTAGRWRRGE